MPGIKREIKIGIADGHKLFSTALASAISSETAKRKFRYIVLFTASDDYEMIQQLNHCGVPDIVILDIEMPRMDGFQSLEWLRQNKPAIKVIIYTEHDDEALITRAIKNGACRYLVKSPDLDDILDAMDSVSADHISLTENEPGDNSETKREIKIAIVDDHKLLSEGLALAISKAGAERSFDYTVLFTACDGHDMIQQLEHCGDPGVIILDIQMPGMDGFESLDWLRLNKPEIKVIMFTIHDNEELVIRAFRKGACAYFTKDAELSEVLNAVDAASEDDSYKQKINLRDIHNNANRPIRITKMEFRLLYYLMTELTEEEIAVEMQLSRRMITYARQELFEKLKIRSRMQLVCG